MVLENNIDNGSDIRNAIQEVAKENNAMTTSIDNSLYQLSATFLKLFEKYCYDYINRQSL